MSAIRKAAPVSDPDGDAGPQLRLVADNEVAPAATPRRPRPRPQRAPRSVGPEWTWGQRAKAGGAVVAGMGAVFAGGLAFGASELGAMVAWWICTALGLAVLLVLAVLFLASRGGDSPTVTVRGKIVG